MNRVYLVAGSLVFCLAMAFLFLAPVTAVVVAPPCHGPGPCHEFTFYESLSYSAWKIGAIYAPIGSGAIVGCPPAGATLSFGFVNGSGGDYRLCS